VFYLDQAALSKLSGVGSVVLYIRHIRYYRSRVLLSYKYSTFVCFVLLLTTLSSLMKNLNWIIDLSFKI